MTEPLHVGDVGAEIEVESKSRDLTGHAVTMTLIRPNGTTPATPIACTIDSSGSVAVGLTRAGDLTVAGTYQVLLSVGAGWTVGTAYLPVLEVPTGEADT